MAKKKKKFKLFHLVSAVLVLLLVVVGVITLLGVDHSGGVGYLYYNESFGDFIGLGGGGTIYKGLGAIFGGSVEIGNFLVKKDGYSEIEYTGLTKTLNANIGAIIGLVLVVIGALVFVVLNKNKVGSFLSTILLLTGTILLFTSHLVFSLSNDGLIEEFAKYDSIKFFDFGALLCGSFCAGATLFSLINSVVCLIKK